MNFRGSLNLLILKNLQGGKNHGYAIAQEIKETSKGVLDFKEGTLYPALHSLEQKGLIVSHPQVENGRTRCYYELTESGKKTLSKEREDWRRYANAVSLVLKEATS